MDESTCTWERCTKPGPRGGRCRDCENMRAAARSARNRERNPAYMAAYRETNRAQARAYNRDYYAQHPEVFAAKYQENRDELIARKRAARAANPGSETENSRRWRREHPEQWALRNRENQRRRRARDEDPVDYAAILAEHGMVCHICGGEIASLADLHMEHVIPLARGGRHHRNNIRPAHALCNLRKGVSI